MTTLGSSPGPVARAVMTQRWDHVTFVHWRYEPHLVQPLLPEGLEVETFDGSAWVGLVPFHMRDIGPTRPSVALPWFGTFPETNIRTYVVGPGGRRGVYFSSLDVTRSTAVAVARAWYRLPYCWAKMSIDAGSDEISYRSLRRWPRDSARSRAVVAIGPAIPAAEVSDLEHFLTARWGLWTLLRSSLAYGRVDHEPWPLHRAEIVELDETLTTAAGLPPPASAPVVHYSPGVDVTVGWLERAASDA